jgi:hypothetical protein
MFNQGIVVYETTLPREENVDIKMVVRDFAVVFIGNHVLLLADRTKSTTCKFTVSKDNIIQFGKKLKIMVEATGHINFDKYINTDRKGLFKFESSLKENLEWKMYKCPVSFEFVREWKPMEKQA